MDGEIRIVTKLDTKSFEEQIRKLKDDLEGLEAEFNIYDASTDLNSAEQKRLAELPSIIERKKNQLYELQKKQNKLDEQNLEDQDDIVDSQGKQADGLKKILSKAKQYGMAILGARGAYMAIRKVINSVTADNEKLANTITGMWAGIGAIFEPFITTIIEGLGKVLSYAMTVVKVLTGVDVFAKAQKAIAKQNKNNTLASFDKSEVLNKGKSNDSYLKQIELGEKAMAILKEIQEWWDGLNFVEKIALIISGVSTVLFLFNAIKDLGLLKKAVEFLTPILTKFGGIVTLITGIVLALKAFFTMWNEGFDGATAWLYVFGVALASIGAMILGAPALLTGVIGAIIAIIGLLVVIIKDQWDESLTFGQNVLNGLITAFEKFVNVLIKGLNWLIDKINSISFEVPSWVPVIGGKSLGFNLGHVGEVSLPRIQADGSWAKIPKLAQGAVIQPNKPFMAMLGDQRFGNNIEAPEELIRQIVAEESGSKNITINASGDLGQLIRLLKFELDKENRRTGTALVVG